MKYLPVLALWLILAPVVKGENPYILARDCDLAGKHRYNCCEVYATSLLWAMQANRTEAYLIRYKWSQGRDEGYHCVVVFKDGTRWFMQDNLNWLPTWVDDLPNFTDMLKEFHPSMTVEIISVTK